MHYILFSIVFSSKTRTIVAPKLIIIMQRGPELISEEGGLIFAVSPAGCSQFAVARLVGQREKGVYKCLKRPYDIEAQNQSSRPRQLRTRI